MDRIIDELKARASQISTTSFEETFPILFSAACSECCSDHSGGNGTCPPPPDTKA